MLPVPYARTFKDVGIKHGISPCLLAAQAKAESMSFNKAVIECRLKSPTGAMGISQFMPATAKAWNVNPCDVNSAVDGQARFMRHLLVSFNWREELALAAYNSGPGRVKALGRVPRIKETQRYVKFIMTAKAEYGDS